MLLLGLFRSSSREEPGPGVTSQHAVFPAVLYRMELVCTEPSVLLHGTPNGGFLWPWGIGWQVLDIWRAFGRSDQKGEGGTL